MNCIVAGVDGQVATAHVDVAGGRKAILTCGDVNGATGYGEVVLGAKRVMGRVDAQRHVAHADDAGF